MNKVLSFVLLLGVCATASSVQVQNICPHDTFKYEDLLVNAVYKFSHSVTFPPIRYYMLNDSIVCNKSDFKNPANFLEVLPMIKGNYNLKMGQILSPYFVSSASVDDLASELNEIQDLYYDVFGKVMDEEGHLPCLLSYSNAMHKGLMFIVKQQPFGQDRLLDTEGDYASPLKKGLMDHVKKTIDNLKIDTNTQAFSFANDSLTDIYRKQIVLKQKLVLNKHSSKMVDYDTKPVVTFDFFLPFHTKNYDPSKECLSYRELPKFFKRKVHW